MADFPVPVITGLGLMTPLGPTPAATWAALLAGRSITTHSRVSSLEADGQPRVNVLAKRVARQAIAQARWDASALRDAALVVGTSKGPVERWIPSASDVLTKNSPAFGLAEVASVTARALRLGDGPRLTLCGACASGLAALARAAMLIRSAQARRVIVVAAESSVHPLFIASFARLGILPPEGVGCRPFDRERAGFLLSEAAAALCLEDSRDVQGRGISALERCFIGGDATHLTGNDPQGRTIRRLLAMVLDGRGVDLIHAHGTGTLANEPIELAAVEDAIGGVGAGTSGAAVLYSHKGALGHSLGASGLVSVVLNCLMHRDSVIPPNVRTRSPLATIGVRLSPPDGPLSHRVDRSVVLAAGFGGAAAVVGLRSCD